MKNTLTRRILAVLLSLAMVLALVPAVFAGTFSDVPAGAWYESAVEYCYENKLMSGTGEGFNPTGKVTREQAVQTLYALSGSPAVEYEALFTDVRSGVWYTNAIIWGAKNNIVAGTGNGMFGVGQNVTREQVATFFFRYGSYVRMEEDYASLNKFSDNGKVSSWAKTALQWATAKGIISGQGQPDNTVLLNPKGNLTRCELASILTRFHPLCLEAPGPCAHVSLELRNAVEPTCTEDGYTGDTYCGDCGILLEKGEVIPAAGHTDENKDGFCDVCDEWLGGDKVFTLADRLFNGQQVVIYSPGHQMAVKNETDNNWYLVPEAITLDEGDVFINPDESLVWTVVDNGDGTWSFRNGENAIAVWVSGTYLELTNDAAYEGADIRWKITDAGNNYFFISSAAFSGSYGPGYIECYYNSSKDKTNISCYSSSNPTTPDFGFLFYAFGKECVHEWDNGVPVAPTCTEDGYTLFTCTLCGAHKREAGEPATGHVDKDGDYFCDICTAELERPQGDFYVGGELQDGDKVVIYNPGHGMAIKNETDNNWYLIPEAVTPADGVISGPDASLVWTVSIGTDGITFTNGSNQIMMWVSGNYFELTNDAAYTDANGVWTLISADSATYQYYILHSSFMGSYGPAYIECYYNSNKDTTRISGYSAATPSLADFGFQFYIQGGTICDHDWVAGEPVAPTCLEDGYTPYTCSKCSASKKSDTVPALGHIDENSDWYCDRCGADMGAPTGDFTLASAIADGDQVVIYNPGHGMAVKNENDNNWYLMPETVTPADGKITDPDASLVWTVVANSDGTYSFTNGSNAIVCWMNNSYAELTNVANYSGSDAAWTVAAAQTGNLFYISSSTKTGSYGPVYIECYYNANKETTRISGYSTSSPSDDDFGFQFYVKGGTVCEHEWVAGEPVAPTCLEGGYTPYSCSKCGATKKDNVTDALGHEYENGVCIRCGAIEPVSGGSFVLAESLADGDELVIYNPANSVVIGNTLNGTRAASVEAAVDVDVLEAPVGAAIFTVTFADETNFYLVTAEGKYFTSGETGNSVSFADAASDLALWYLAPVEGGFNIMNKTAAYSGTANQAIEYYNGNFTTYGVSDTDAFLMQLFVKGTPCEHQWTETGTSAPTCTEPGYTYSTCGLCGKTKRVENASPLGHEWEIDEKNSKVPTCLDAGVLAYVCKACGDTKTEDGEAALGHIDEDSNGICDRCGKDLSAPGWVVADSVSAGDKIVVVVNYNGEYYALTNDGTSVKNAVNALQVNVTNDLDIGGVDCVMTLETGATEGSFRLRTSTDKYISWTAGGTTMGVNATGTDVTITCGAGTSSLIFPADTTRGIIFRSNAGVPQFRGYKLTNKTGEYCQKITIYKLG